MAAFAPHLWLRWLLVVVSLVVVGTRAAVEKDPNMKSIPLRTHSLSAPYLDTDMHSRWFDFGGDTIIRADQYIRLAPDRQSREGWIFSRVPLTATNWEVEFEFKIHGAGSLHADGFALWVTKERATPGPVFGHADRFEGLGVFFDTYKNNRPGVVFPYVMAMLGDGKTAYDQPNDGKENEVAGCSARGLRGATIPTKARVTYFQEKSLHLELQYKSEDEWTECFTIEHSEAKPIRMPTVAYLGFSAETGELSDNFDLINVESRNLYSPAGYNSGSGAGAKGGDSAAAGGRKGGKGRPTTPKEGGSWTWFFFKVFVFFGLVGGGYVGWTMYRTQKRTRF
ncbi:MAG: hypothetical protein Q9160_002783 [Pyrenula sp. 1 TL-2023]